MAAQDVILVAVVLFTLTIGGFITFYASNTVVDKMINITAINSSSDAVTALQSTKTASGSIDYLTLALFIGMVLGIIITGFLVGGHPIFMGAYFLIVTVGVIISAIMANLWEDVTGASIFGSTITSFPIANHLITYLPYYVAAVGIIGIIVMFAKPQEVGY